MTGPNNNNEVAWLFIVFVGGGGFGFVADGIVLLTLIYVFDVHPLLSRIFSFGSPWHLRFSSTGPGHSARCANSICRPPSQRRWQYKASGLCVISPSTHLLS
jgi:hypothetical protein